MNASNINKALTLYAQDHEGKFPEGVHSSNEAFRQLFRGRYLEIEKPFHVPGSAWHAASPGGRGPDDDLGAALNFAQCLEAGENHWAYVSGLTQTDSSKLPIIVDGFVPGTQGTYTDNRKEKGGV